MSEAIKSKQILGNFNCCKCYLKQSSDSQIQKFSQSAPTMVGCLEEGEWSGGEGTGSLGKSRKGEGNGMEGEKRGKEEGRRRKGGGEGEGRGKGFKSVFAQNDM